MYFADQSGVLALIRLLPICDGCGHPHWLGGIPSYFPFWSLSDEDVLYGFIIIYFVSMNVFIC